MKKAELLGFGDKTSKSEKAAYAEAVKKATPEDQVRLEKIEAKTEEIIINQNYDISLSEIPNSMGARKVASIICLIGSIISTLLAVYALHFTFTIEYTDTLSKVINIIETMNMILVSIMLVLLWRLLRKSKGYISNTIGSVSLVCFVISGLILISCLVLVLRKMLLNHPSLTFDIVEEVLLAIAFYIIWRKAKNRNSKQ